MAWFSNWMDDVRLTVTVTEIAAREKLTKAYIPFRWRSGGGFLGNRLLRGEWQGNVLCVRGPQNLTFTVHLSGSRSVTSLKVRTHTGRVYQILSILGGSALLGVAVGWERTSSGWGAFVGGFAALFFLGLFSLSSLTLKSQRQRFLVDLQAVLAE